MKLSDAPENLRVYLFHEVEELHWTESQATGDCPFCGREQKFGIKVQTGQFGCLVCGEQGNALTFMRQLWKLSDESTTDYGELAQDRGLAFSETVLQWEAAKSITTGEWIVPARNYQNQICQLYRLVSIGGKRKLLANPKIQGVAPGMFGRTLYDPDCSVVYLCEGPWDGMAWWEILQRAKRGTDGRISLTASPGASLGGEASVLALPGCNTFLTSWAPLLEGKDVAILFDNDHPRPHPKTGAIMRPVGRAAVDRVARIIQESTSIASLRFLEWGGGGFDPELPSGYDLRDVLQAPLKGDNRGSGGNGSEPAPGLGDPSHLAHRLRGVENILGLLTPLPEAAVSGPQGAPKQGSSNGGLDPLPCNNYRRLSMAWRKALKWSKGLDRALAVMLASIASVKIVGDPLWVKVMGPAACGKSTLCEAISVNRQYVRAISTMRGFHSGFRLDGDKDADHSLVSQLFDMTLVTKDGDTLLQAPNLPQILAEARDIYDGTARTHYRNAMSKDYEGIRMTWILCGTASLRQIDSSELGERFLDCVIMDRIDPDKEEEVLWRVAHRANTAMELETDGLAGSHYDPDLAIAMRMTGGYIAWLRDNAPRVIPSIAVSRDTLQECIQLGQFVAYMRARPSIRQQELAEREFASRLVSQHIRLAKCLAFVFNRKRVDKATMRQVKDVTMDTSRGKVLNIVESVEEHRDGLQPKTVAVMANMPQHQTVTLLHFMRHIGIVETCSRKVDGVAGPVRWRLTERLRDLREQVASIGK